jgi:type IV pilus assembly protein PilQ
MVLRNRSFLSVNGPAVSMTMRNAPARDVLMALAQMGGYGFVYVDDDQPAGTSSPTGAATGTTSANQAQGRPVSIAFRGETYARALNSVLLAAGLQGRLEGNMILAGPSVLGKTFGAQLSKVYRLNQATAASAADYLASLGAKITKVTLITNTVSQGTTQANQVAGAPDSQQTQTQRITTTETYGASTGPLKGLTGTTDSRLQTITLVGDPQVVAVAENYLRQIDLRQRQVALSVRILDVSLANDSTLSNSFAFRYGNNFIVNDDGSFSGAWGRFLPPSSTLVADTVAGPVANPGMQYPKNEFFDALKATIQSQSTKLLASPTLIISENAEQILGGGSVVPGASSGAGGASRQAFQAATIGRERANESFVTVGTQVITDYTVTTGTQGNGNACEPEFSTAGLTFGARVTKIDDNGFVTFNLSPAVSAITDQDKVENCGPINILSVRRLDTGSVRVRDGQTLILTGVISDFNSQGANKIPLLGDLPLIGQFFRSTTNSRSKNELVILVTPRIINDVEGGAYGYGYQPATPDSRQLMAAPAGAAGF